MRYDHTQRGYIGIFVLIFVVAVYVFVSMRNDEFYWPSFFLIILVVLVVSSFSSLNVRVDNSEIRLRFGYGLFGRRFALKDVESVRVVRNPWFVGWGVRLMLPRTWVFNVAGFDAVELRMKNGRVYRIGTDEPEKLERAILDLIKK